MIREYMAMLMIWMGKQKRAFFVLLFGTCLFPLDYHHRDVGAIEYEICPEIQPQGLQNMKLRNSEKCVPVCSGESPCATPVQDLDRKAVGT